MALQNLKELSSLFDRNNQEKIRKDRLEAQKLKNEQDKLLLERAKIAGQFQKDKVETKATETDTLGKELDNKQTKLGLIGQLADLLIPSAGGVKREHEDKPLGKYGTPLTGVDMRSEGQRATDDAQRMLDDRKNTIADIPEYQEKPKEKPTTQAQGPVTPITDKKKGQAQGPTTDEDFPDIPEIGPVMLSIPSPPKEIDITCLLYTSPSPRD